jgi:metal-responsive CopG/Arc/MetJ family transcriptional regulator
LEKFVARKPEKEVISMRISTETLKEIDDKAATVGISRNELINQMIRYALENMADNSSSE